MNAAIKLPVLLLLPINEMSFRIPPCGMWNLLFCFCIPDP
jgi:hypothetical protein